MGRVSIAIFWLLVAIALAAFFMLPAQAARIGTVSVTFVDSEVAPDHVVEKALDNDINTYWMSGSTRSFHSINFDFSRVYGLSEICYRARQTGTAGKVDIFAVYSSTDGRQWGIPDLVGNFTTSTDRQCASLTGVSTRFLRFVALASHEGPTATVAEMFFRDDSIGAFLLETGGYLLLEDGGKLLLE